mmetsp:Transcript_12285/g.21575  ORF Transcript_12285/g.21575 Transcript_12285/m.21575 type:complete len:292 (-) Transcript_12285:221-1096(-)
MKATTTLTMSTTRKLPCRTIMHATLTLFLIIASLFVLVDATTNGTMGVTLCGCPESACPGNCNVFAMNQCQPFYQCFLEANGIFGHVHPKLDSTDGEVVVEVFNDEACQNPRFEDPASNGWKGSCDSTCWSKISKIGAQGCEIQEEVEEDLNDMPAPNNGDVVEDTVRLCGCPETSACPNICDRFTLNKCQPFYQCFLETNGIFAHVLPELDSDGDVVVHVFNDETCQNKRFDSVSNGFKGSCTNNCWSQTSQIGAGGCSIPDTTTDSSATKQTVRFALAIASFGSYLFLF